MEKELFTYENWDKVGFLNLIFHNCKLIKNIYHHKMGEKFKSIIINYEDGSLILYSESNVVETFSIGLVVK